MNDQNVLELFGLLDETKESFQKNSSLLEETKDVLFETGIGVLSISSNISEYIKYVKESNEESRIINEISAEGIKKSLTNNNSLVESNNGLISNITFLNEILFDISQNPQNLLVSSMTKLRLSIDRLSKSSGNSDTSKSESSEGEGVNLSNFSSSVQLIVTTIFSINKQYTKKAIIFSRTIDLITNSLYKNFKSEDSKMVLANAKSFTEFVKSYYNIFASIKEKNLNKSKIQRILRTFDLFRDISASKEDIEKASSIGKVLIDFALSIKSFFDTIRKTKIPSDKKFTMISSRINKFIKDIAKTIKDTDAKKSKEITDVLNALGKGVVKFAKRMIFAGPLLILATPGLLMFRAAVWFLGPTFNYLAKNGTKMRAGGKALQTIGWGILMLTSAVVLSSMMLAGADTGELIIGVTAIMGLSWMFMKFYTKFGSKKNVDNVKEGVKAMALITLANLMVVASLRIMSIGISGKGWGNIGLAILAIGALTLMYYFIGSKNISGNVQKAAIALGLMGLSLVVLGFSIDKVAGAFNKNSKMIIGLPFMLGGLAIVFILAGKFGEFIVNGAIVFGAIGLSLLLLSFSLDKIATTLQKNSSILWKLPVLIVSLGVMFGLMGIPPIALAIAMGAVAMGAVGLALYSIAKPFEMIAKADMSKKKFDEFAYGIKTVMGAFISSARMVKLSDIPKIYTLNKISRSLGKFATGLSKWKEVISGWTERDTDMIADLIPRIVGAIAVGTSPEYISERYGVKVTQKDIRGGIRSTMRLGRNLKRLAKGINAWKEMNLAPEDAIKISENITTILSVVPFSIAKIGKFYKKDNQDEEATLKYNNGEMFTRGELRRGLKFTRKIGRTLKTLAEGVKYWKEAKLEKSDIDSINDNVSLILSVLPYVIAKVGKFHDKGNSEATAELAVKGLEPYTRKQLRLGIKYTRRIGGVLESLANGVKYWKEAKIEKNDVEKITENVSLILGLIPSEIAKLGKDDGDTKKVGLLGMFSKTDTQRGIDYVFNIGNSLKALADGVKYWATAKLTSSQIIAIKQNVSDIIKALPQIFADVGADENTQKKWGVFKSDAEKGIDIVNKLSKPLFEVSKTVSAFESIANPLERSKQIGGGVKSLLKDTVDGLSVLSMDKISLFDKFLDPLKRFTEIIMKFSKEMKDIGKIDWTEVHKINDAATNYDVKMQEGRSSRNNLNRSSDEFVGQNNFVSATNAGVSSFSPTPFGSKSPSKSPSKTPLLDNKQDNKQDVMMQTFTQTINSLKQEISKINSKMEEINNKLVTSGGAINVNVRN